MDIEIKHSRLTILHTKPPTNLWSTFPLSTKQGCQRVVKGVSKGCQRGAKGVSKEIKGLSKGCQRGAKGASKECLRGVEGVSKELVTKRCRRDVEKISKGITGIFFRREGCLKPLFRRISDRMFSA